MWRTERMESCFEDTVEMISQHEKIILMSPVPAAHGVLKPILPRAKALSSRGSLLYVASTEKRSSDHDAGIKISILSYE